MTPKSHLAKRDGNLQDRISEPSPKLERIGVATHQNTDCLDDMLAQIISENLHPEWDTGPTQGKEEW